MKFSLESTVLAEANWAELEVKNTDNKSNDNFFFIKYPPFCFSK